MKYYTNAPAVFPRFIGAASRQARPGDLVTVYDKEGGYMKWSAAHPNTQKKTDIGMSKSEYEKLIAAGVIDPTKVSRIALENAASIAGMLLTTECVIVDEPTEEGAMPNMGGMGGGMPGMM